MKVKYRHPEKYCVPGTNRIAGNEFYKMEFSKLLEIATEFQFETLLTDGNSKLGIIPNFSLLSFLTCPGFTEWCKNKCFGKNGNYMYDSNVIRTVWNYLQTIEPSFVDRMVSELIVASFNVNRMRLHGIGDLYNQQYLDDWKIIARAVPKIKILAYTRSYMLDFNDLPKNLIIRYSVDPTTTQYPTITLPVSEIVPKKTTVSDSKLCDTKCFKCSYCWNSKNTIQFPERF
jgi:hypothetical protein